MQRYFCNLKDNNHFLLSDDDKYHITRVMRMQTGNKIEVVYNHEVYICEIDLNNGFEVSVFEYKSDLKVEEPTKVLIIPLLKEQKMDLILQKATELGVDEIIPVIMERSIIKLDSQREEKRIDRWTKICKEAAEQSKRVSIPVVTKIKNLIDLETLEGLKIVCSTTEKDLTIKKILTMNKIMIKLI